MLRQFYLNIYFGLVDLFVLMKFIYEPSSLWILKKLQIHSWFAQVYIHTKHIDTHVSGSTHTPTRTFSCRHIESRVVLVVISLNLYRVQAAVSVVLVARGSRGRIRTERGRPSRIGAERRNKTHSRRVRPLTSGSSTYTPLTYGKQQRAFREGHISF